MDDDWKYACVCVIIILCMRLSLWRLFTCRILVIFWKRKEKWLILFTLLIIHLTCVVFNWKRMGFWKSANRSANLIVIILKRSISHLCWLKCYEWFPLWIMWVKLINGNLFVAGNFGLFITLKDFLFLGRTWKLLPLFQTHKTHLFSDEKANHLYIHFLQQFPLLFIFQNFPTCLNNNQEDILLLKSCGLTFSEDRNKNSSSKRFTFLKHYYFNQDICKKENVHIACCDLEEKI